VPDDTCRGAEAGGERLRGLHDDGLVLFLASQQQSVQVAGAYHEAYVVMPRQVLHGVQVFGVLLAQRFPFFVTGQFVQVPHAAGEEARTPVVNGYIDDASVFFNGTRVQDFAAFLDEVGLQRVLRYGVCHVLLDEVGGLWLVLAGCHAEASACDDGGWEGEVTVFHNRNCF